MRITFFCLCDLRFWLLGLLLLTLGVIVCINILIIVEKECERDLKLQLKDNND